MLSNIRLIVDTLLIFAFGTRLSSNTFILG